VKKAITRSALFLAMFFVLALLMNGCGGDSVFGPGAVVSPSPSPTPKPSPSTSPSPSPSPSPQTAASCTIRGDGIVFGIGPKQPRTLEVLVFDADRTLIPNRTGNWSHAGPIQPAGADNGQFWEYYAVTAGFAVVKVAVPGTPGCDFRITIVETYAQYLRALAAARR